MKYIKHYWDTTILLIIMWCILNENISVTTLIVGFFAALITIILIRLLFSKNDDIKNYRIRPYLFIWFIGILYYHIIKSAISTTKAIFNHDVNPVFVELNTSLHNHWFQCLVANSITLTPGTVTIDKTDHKLTVLWLYSTTDDKKEQAELIFGAFENILKKGDFKR